MKCTLNLDVELIERVKSITNSRTRTDAIHYALREIDRRDRLIKILQQGSGVEGEDLQNLFDPASDPSLLRVAESPSPYPKKSS